MYAFKLVFMTVVSLWGFVLTCFTDSYNTFLDRCEAENLIYLIII